EQRTVRGADILEPLSIEESEPFCPGDPYLCPGRPSNDRTSQVKSVVSSKEGALDTIDHDDGVAGIVGKPCASTTVNELSIRRDVLIVSIENGNLLPSPILQGVLAIAAYGHPETSGGVANDPIDEGPFQIRWRWHFCDFAVPRLPESAAFP